jgi:hypothetical protein
MGAVAAIHPGRVLQCFDHFVADLRGDDGADGPGAYFTVYAVEYSPELGTGHVAFLRVRGAGAAGSTDDLDLTLTDNPALAHNMQARLRRMLVSTDMSRGIGTRLDQEPIPARFQRLPWTAAGVGWQIDGDGVGPHIEARWTDGEAPIWTAAPAGTFTDERDILGMLAGFGRATVEIDGRAVPGEPFADPWWETRLGRQFSSCHVALAEASLEPGGGWWDTLAAPRANGHEGVAPDVAARNSATAGR